MPLSLQPACWEIVLVLFINRAQGCEMTYHADTLEKWEARACIPQSLLFHCPRALWARHHAWHPGCQEDCFHYLWISVYPLLTKGTDVPCGESIKLDRKPVVPQSIWCWGGCWRFRWASSSQSCKTLDALKEKLNRWYDGGTAGDVVKACVEVKVTPSVRLFVTPRQAPLSLGFSRQEYWSG